MVSISYGAERERQTDFAVQTKEGLQKSLQILVNINISTWGHFVPRYDTTGTIESETGGRSLHNRKC